MKKIPTTEQLQAIKQQSLDNCIARINSLSDKQMTTKQRIELNSLLNKMFLSDERAIAPLDTNSKGFYR
ncbi:MAG: hypothetical protein OEY79_03610 [Anaplasmataceae bacterium]|nr:hypothetical protein [Anaplasmataceae bacterium]